MLDRLELIPLAAGPLARPPLALGSDSAPGAGAALVRDPGGGVAVVEGDLAGLQGSARGPVLAFLRALPRRQAAAPPEAVVVPSGEQILVNGLRPFKLGVIGPGDVLSVAGEDWLVARRLRAEPGPAPPEIASKACPVCGMALSLGTCAMHRCGVYMHIARGAAGEGEGGQLDCYRRSSNCTVCGGEIQDGEELIPDPEAARWSDVPLAGAAGGGP